MASPRIPDRLVELGRAVEVDSDNYKWEWTAKENHVVACSENGKTLFVFPRGKNRATQLGDDDEINEAMAIYKTFNRKNATAGRKVKVRDKLKREGGRAIHIIYNSDKFGDRHNYIHTFDSPPIVWVDREWEPRMIVLTGGSIHITKRGIEG